MQLGTVQLLINEEGGRGDRIQLSRKKTKNSTISLRVLQGE